MPNTGPDKTVVEAVLERAQWKCEACGVMLGNWHGIGYSIHHRRPRGMGGTRFGANLPSNLMAVCGSGTTGCHGWIESHPFEAMASGWSVSRYQDPAQVKVDINGSWIYLGNDCTYRAAP